VSEWTSVMPFVSGKRFVCECGCNVFSKRLDEPDVYYCNACPNRYESN
jgi:hypothetical protein